MRTVLGIGLVALVLVVPAVAADWAPPADWMVQAKCVHVQEASWTANTGNGYFGGMQFMPQTWKRMGGKPDPAFKHPGDPTYPFRASSSEQLYRAWLLWKHDGGTWKSWGAVGASCS